MSNFNIAVLPGDYIGPEIIAEAQRVLGAVGRRFGHHFDYKIGLAGGDAWDHFRNHLPPATIKICEAADAILKGPFGGPTSEINHPKWQGVEQNAILPLRKHFDLFLNLRPIIVPDALLGLSPVKEEHVKGTDILVCRELSSGIYFGPRGDHQVEGPHETTEREVFDTEVYREHEIDRMARASFDLAMQRRKKVTLVAKSNVMASGLFWREVVDKVAQDFPEVSLDYLHVDNAAMQIILNPRQFDVILTSNMFGDILSDEAAALLRSLGMGPSASLNEKGFGLYEPIHGSAPDIAGQGKANPIATILSAAMMLRLSFHLADEARAVETAVDRALAEGLRTPDLAAPGEPTVTTRDMSRRISELVTAS